MAAQVGTEFAHVHEHTHMRQIHWHLDLDETSNVNGLMIQMRCMWDRGYIDVDHCSDGGTNSISTITTSSLPS